VTPGICGRSASNTGRQPAETGLERAKARSSPSSFLHIPGTSSASMEIYLPIAGMSQDLFLILGLGAAVGILLGMFGVGGGFLLTPLLMQIGIPPAIAVASAANQVVG